MQTGNIYKVDLNSLIEDAKKCLSEEEFMKIWRRLRVKSAFTQRQYLSFLNRLCEAGALHPTMREQFTNYVLKELAKYKNKNTRLTYFYAAKFIATTLGIPFDLFREDAVYGAEESQLKRTPKLFTISEVEKLIKVAFDLLVAREEIKVFDYKFSPLEPISLLLVTTLYGTRRGEYYLLQPEDIDIEHGVIFIKALKKSVQRRHLIPPDLQKLFYLVQEGVRKKAPDARYYNTLFKLMMFLANIRLERYRNIHAIRKTLASLLLTRMPDKPAFVNDFLRWKGQGTMMAYYVNLDPLYVDMEVFKYHPFLELWRKEIRERKMGLD
jgi:integrase